MNECILVVDDDREIVKAIAILLEKKTTGFCGPMMEWKRWISWRETRYSCSS